MAKNTMQKKEYYSRPEFFAERPSLPLSTKVRSLFAFTNPERFPESLPEERLVEHIVKVRNRTWDRTSYPCLGRFRFLEPGSTTLVPFYQEALDHVASSPQGGRKRMMLDLACGYGQDLRSWIQSGKVQPDQAVGAELVPEFLEDGHLLFGDERDKGHLKGTQFLKCNAFDDVDLARVKAASTNGEGFDVIYIGSFLHLFDLKSQQELTSRIARLLYPGKGSFIFGRQTGLKEGQAQKIDRPFKSAGEKEEDPQMDSIFRHDTASFTKMWEEHARVQNGGEVKVDVALKEHRMLPPSTTDEKGTTVGKEETAYGPMEMVAGTLEFKVQLVGTS